MTPSTFDFTGDFVTVLGFVGVLSTLLIVVTAFRRFFNSPLNLRVTVPKVAQDAPDAENSEVFYESSEES